MTTQEKLWQKILQNPHKISFREIDTFLNNKQFNLVRQKGSHCIFFHKNSGKMFVIPKKTPVKKIYIKQIIKYFQS